ncbi:MAG TPA: hypothetical protein VLL54_10800 [Pyrinomonadaceae bacterium]|nr:hypothetical protein [Pyrinomonadaceae bacterium]
MRNLLIVAGIVTLLLCVPAVGYACDCVTRSPEQSFADADNVFVGEVVRHAQELTTTFRVVKSVKGKNAEEMTIVSGGSNCDAFFNLGTVYLVYAKSFENKLISGVCFGNAVVGISEEAAADAQNKVYEAARASAPAALPNFYRRLGAILGVSAFLCVLIWFLPLNLWRRPIVEPDEKLNS